MKRYRKQAKIAMAIALTTNSLASSMPTIAAKEEVTMQENNFENKNEVLETEVLSTEKEDTSVEEVTPEIKSEEKYQSIEKADGDVILNEQYFPDAGFREFIKEATSLNDNDVLTEEKRNQITEISIQGDENNPRTDVRSLEGIQYFPNLERLDCAYQTELTGVLDLTSHKNLQVVRVRNTKIEGIDVTGLTNLAAISIAHSNIGGELDLRTNTGLQRIYAFNTILTGLKVDGLTNL
ncbi:MAG: hypothetical protein K2F55_02080, partial [Erysipelotrichaceae bacterium]|nr:hypothetical protein [Erysipelotrichaceae bacterium]